MLFPYEEFMKIFNCEVINLSPRGLLNCGNRYTIITYFILINHKSGNRVKTIRNCVSLIAFVYLSKKIILSDCHT